jgi:hypothetical protein
LPVAKKVTPAFLNDFRSQIYHSKKVVSSRLIAPTDGLYPKNHGEGFTPYADPPGYKFRPTPSTKIAWYAYRAIFRIIALRAKGKAGSIWDRN